ncbi:TPA: hypothetical protein HA246_00310 [Candidatus Woesearchaeota archaeon]|nr:hypothetical protein [Candidatus Woesearchaeota archaeon]
MNKKVIIFFIILGFVLIYLALLYGTNLLVGSIAGQSDEFNCQGICTICFINNTKCLCSDAICNCKGIDVDRAECGEE